MKSRFIFMPWYVSKRTLSFGTFTITPIDIETENLLTQIQRNILELYLVYPTTPDRLEFNKSELSIKNFNLITSNERIAYEDLFKLQIIFSIAALYNRKLTNPHKYLNSDNFKIYSHPNTDTSIGTDVPIIGGNYGSLSDFKWFREVRPNYVPVQELSANKEANHEINHKLASKLWEISISTEEEKHWENYIFPSIYAYHCANSGVFTSQISLNYFLSAFEKLLCGSDHGKKNILAACKHLDFTGDYISEGNFRKSEKKDNINNIFQAWISELTDIRNDFAHGKFQTKKAKLWSIEEHRLLSAFIYPYVLEFKLFGELKGKQGLVLKKFDKLLDSQNLIPSSTEGVLSSFELECLLDS